MTTDNFSIALGRLLRTERKRAGLSQAQAAEQIKITPSHLSRLEGGQVKDPSHRLIATIAQVYGVDASVFSLQPATRSLLSVRSQIKLLFEMYETGKTVNLLDYVPDLQAAVAVEQPATMELAMIWRLLSLTHREAGRYPQSLFAAERSLAVLSELPASRADIHDLQVIIRYNRSRTFQAMDKPELALTDAYAMQQLLPRCMPLVRGVAELEIARVLARNGRPMVEWVKMLNDAQAVAAQRPSAEPTTGFSISTFGALHGYADAMALAVLASPSEAAVYAPLGFSALDEARKDRGHAENRWRLHLSLTGLMLGTKRHPTQAIVEAQYLLEEVEISGSRVLAGMLQRAVSAIPDEAIDRKARTKRDFVLRRSRAIGQPISM